MNRMILFGLMICMGIAIAPSETFATDEDAGTLREVVATGTGATEEAAKRDAFHNAVEQAVGVYVDATTIANNDKLIEDSVLTYSNAYIKSFTVIRSSVEGSVHTIKIRAMVKAQRLAEKLKSQGIKTAAIDGQSLAAEIVTTKRMEEDGKTLLRKAIGDYPLQFVEFTPSSKVSPNETRGLDATVRFSVNKDNYRKYITELERVLKLQASQTGTGTILVTPGYFLFPPGGMSKQSEGLFHEILDNDVPKTRGKRFLLILGKAVGQQDEKKARQVVINWYVLRGDMRPVVMQAYRRSVDLILHCSLKDDQNQSIIEIPKLPYHDAEQDGHFRLIPGRPVYTYPTGGKDMYADFGGWEDQGGIAVLPMLSLFGGSGMGEWMESVKCTMHFDISVDEIAKVKKLVVVPELPQEHQMTLGANKTAPAQTMADPAREAFERGEASAEKKDFDSAIADYTEAIRLDPKLAAAYVRRGSGYVAKREWDKAIDDFTEAIRLKPKYAAAYNNRGNAYRGKGEYDKAIAEYTEAIRLNPKLALAYNNRAIAYEKKGEMAKAAADRAKAKELGAESK